MAVRRSGGPRPPARRVGSPRMTGPPGHRRRSPAPPKKNTRDSRGAGAVIGGSDPVNPRRLPQFRRAPGPTPSPLTGCPLCPTRPFPSGPPSALAFPPPRPVVSLSVPLVRGWFSPPELLPAPRPQTASLAGGARLRAGGEDARMAQSNAAEPFSIR